MAKKTKNYKQLIKFLPKKQLLILGIILTIIVSVVEISYAMLIKKLVDASVDLDSIKFIKTLYFIIGLSIINVVMIFWKTKNLGIYTEKGITVLREKIASKFNFIDFNTLSQKHNGEYLSHATNDISKIKNYLASTFPNLIKTSLKGVGALTLLLIISWKLTIISLLIIPIVFVIVGLLTKPIGSMSKSLQEKLGEANVVTSDFIKGIEVAKAYNLETTLANKHNNIIDKSVKLGKSIAKKSSILESLSEVFSIIPFIITFFVGGYLVINNEMSIGGLLAFINLLNHLTFPISNLPMLIFQAKADLASSERIFELLNSKEERQDGEDFKIDYNAPFIEFKNVSFVYNDSNDKTINNLSFKINYHDVVALVGPSGSGKSTLMKLILGYFANYEGEINILGHELKTWNLTKLREKFAFVSQDTYMFPFTIKENIEYGNIMANITEVKNSAKLANADQFISSFEKGYDTVVGELANTLSGGERQRLSIARAILKDAPILLLDEATSALDNESEALVQDALNNVLKNKTSFIIAHRLSTIKNCNKILVLAEGQIVEEGTHDELIAYNSLYKKLYQQQMENSLDGGVLNEK